MERVNKVIKTLIKIGEQSLDDCVLKANSSLKNILDNAKRFYNSGGGRQLLNEKSFIKGVTIEEVKKVEVDFSFKKYKASREIKSIINYFF